MKKSFLICVVMLASILPGQAQNPVPNRIIEYLKKNYGSASESGRHFIYNAVDLNNDGKDEYLVGLTGGDWCGSGGCTMLILDQNIRLISRMTVVNYPVYVGTPGTSEMTKGYSDIYIVNRDGSTVKMVWNGSKYPSNPSIAPKVDKKITGGKFKFLNIAEQEQLTF